MRRDAARSALLSIVVVAIALSIAACAASRRAERPGTEADAAVRAAVKRLLTADNARDLAAVLSSYADDVVWLPPGGEVLTGKDAIRPRYERLFEGFAVDLTSDIVESGSRGDLGFVRGRTAGSLTPVGGGSPVPVDDNFLTLLRCERGVWRISHLMWSPRAEPANPKLPSPPP